MPWPPRPSPALPLPLRRDYACVCVRWVVLFTQLRHAWRAMSLAQLTPPCLPLTPLPQQACVVFSTGVLSGVAAMFEVSRATRPL